jgi:hypothetical protein
MLHGHAVATMVWLFILRQIHVEAVVQAWEAVCRAVVLVGVPLAP